MANTRTTRPRVGTPRARQSKPAPLKIGFMGADYRISDKVGIWPLMQFARAAESGLSMRDARGLSAVHAYLEQVIHEDDWGQFQDDMVTKKTDDLQALFDFAQEAVTALTERTAKKTGRAIEDAVAEVEE